MIKLVEKFSVFSFVTRIFFLKAACLILCCFLCNAASIIVVIAEQIIDNGSRTTRGTETWG